MYRTLPVFAALAACLLAGCRDASPPTGEAEWIWPEAAAADAGQPAAYLLLADFGLDQAPSEKARLFVTADREYAVHLNGHQIARGGFRRGEPIDEVQVAHLLRAGANRLTIEVRTPYGDGGALAGIELADGSMPVTTDSTWRFQETWDPLLVKGAAPLGDGPEPGTVRSWGRPPVGRWGRVVRGELARPEPIWRAAFPHRIVRVSTAPGLDVPPGERSAFRVDFGREVTGVLELEFRPGSAVGAGRLKFCLGGECEWRTLVLTAGRPAWRDSASRTFDTVEVYGLKELRAVRARS
ncbi:MAG: hypothetical protein OXG74_01585 [Acidobacteria bacterium]|nr:hypothetical protein [Acidobacteriota bacterium]